jgi:hypothetical protein
MARHTVGDFSQIINAEPLFSAPDRLPPMDLLQLREQLGRAGLTFCAGEAAERQLAALRALYEPYVAALGARLRLELPPWLPPADGSDDWATTAWQTDPEVALRAVGWAKKRGRVPLEDRPERGDSPPEQIGSNEEQVGSAQSTDGQPRQ